MKKYKVVENFVGFEAIVEVGDMLELGTWHGIDTLMKGDIPICDEDSPAASKYCVEISS